MSAVFCPLAKFVTYLLRGYNRKISTKDTEMSIGEFLVLMQGDFRLNMHYEAFRKVLEHARGFLSS